MHERCGGIFREGEMTDQDWERAWKSLPYEVRHYLDQMPAFPEPESVSIGTMVREALAAARAEEREAAARACENTCTHLGGASRERVALANAAAAIRARGAPRCPSCGVYAGESCPRVYREGRQCLWREKPETEHSDRARAEPPESS